MNNHITGEIPDESKIYTKEGLLEVVNALPLAITVIDKNIKIVLANKSTYLLMNKNEAQLIGRVGGEAFGCIHHDDAPGGCGFGQACLKCTLRRTVQRTMEQKKALGLVETSMIFKGRGEKYLRIYTSPMSLEGNDVVMLSIEDITEAKKHAQAAVEEGKLSVVFQTAGAVCHEMNQPLMVIMGLSELLLKDISDKKNLAANLKIIKKQAEKLGGITRKLMTIKKYKTKEYINTEIIDIDGAQNSNGLEE